MNFRLIAEEKPHHPVSRLARVLGVSRAGFYAWARRPPSERARRDAELTRRITQIHEETDGIYGAPRIQAAHSTEAERPFRRKPNTDSAPSRTPRSEATRLLCEG